MKTLIGMIGLPYSGKTTVAREMGHPMVNPDSIRLAMHGHRFIPEAEDVVWAIARIMVRALFLAGHDTVIVDACNVSQKRRDEWMKPGWENQWVLCDADPDVCKDRALKRGDTDIIPSIDRMNEEWDWKLR